MLNTNKIIDAIENDRKKLNGKELSSYHTFTKEEYVALAEYLLSFDSLSVNYSKENEIENKYCVAVHIGL